MTGPTDNDGAVSGVLANGRDMYFAIREVWFCSLGLNVGSEQDGRGELFERPVLILKTFSGGLFWGVPISTKLKRQNPYYHIFGHEGREYAAIISQLRLLDAKRLVRKIYLMSEAEFCVIQLRFIREIATIQKRTPL